jgi:hypothetical protein
VPARQGGGSLFARGGHLSWYYNQFQDRFRNLLRLSGVDPERFSTHSMRRGGVSELRSLALPEDLIALQGGWQSQECMRRYFDSTVEFGRRAALLSASGAPGGPGGGAAP